MARTHNRFQVGSGKYQCNLCKRMTRATGEGEEQLGMCRQCFDLCSWDNHHNDSGIPPTPKEAELYEDWLAAIEVGGGNSQKVRDFCSFAFPKA